jgi:hypothetical protein
MNALHKQIEDFIDANASAPAQKSAAWYSLKQKTIGGSEVATVLGLNPFKKPYALVAEKIGLPGTAFNGNIATRWGNLFESVTRDYTALILQMKKPILEAGSIEGVIDRQRYSPDGLGVVRLLTGDTEYDYFIVLFEFKSPLRSVPDGKVPKQYMPQVQTGLLSIPICETGIFVNNMYRKCPIKDINFEVTYDKQFHDGDVTKKLTKKQAIKQVYAVGMICFYQTDAEYEHYLTYCGYGDSDEEDSNEELDDRKVDPFVTTSEYDIDLLLNSNEQPIDFGTSKHNIINRLLELHEEKRIHAVYLPIVCNPSVVNEMEFAELHNKKQNESDATENPRKYLKQQYNKFLAECDEKQWTPVGYLPWKLLKSDIISIDAEEDWQETIEEPIGNILSIIDKIMTKKTQDERREAYYEVYPPVEKMSKADRELITESCADLVGDMDDYEDVVVEE